jgi:hypothetical protein
METSRMSAGMAIRKTARRYGTNHYIVISIKL